MRTRTMRTILAALLATLALGAVAAANAGAAPQWKFSGTALTGKEDILGAATSSSMKWSTMTTTCQHFLYNMKVENSGGAGKGELSEVPLFECGTSSPYCTVNWMEAQKFPWPTHLTEVGGKPYLIIEGVYVIIEYGGEECAVGEVEIPLKGTAGGLIDNATETATFSPTTLKATGTELKAAGTAVEWNGVFPTEAFEWHREQPISVG